MNIKKPTSREEFYFSRYIDFASEDDLISSLEASRKQTIEVLGSLDESHGNHAYQSDKWTIKEVLAHCIDTERILAYRALCFSRNEESMLPGFDQDKYERESATSRISLRDLLEEYDAGRHSTILLFKRMKLENIDFKGIASNVDISPRELGWTIAGHDLHHLKVIQEKYLVDKPKRGSFSINLTND